MAFQIQTQIHIHAPAQKVWDILMDFNRYPQWNPFIQNIQGDAQPGKHLVAFIVPVGGKGMTFKPKVLEVKPQQTFRWLGHLWMPGIFDGEHIFELEAHPDGTTTFIQREQFRGILVPVFKSMLRTGTRQGFELMNEQLKQLAEQGPYR